MNHVAHVSVTNAVVHVPQHAGEQHPENHLIKPLSYAGDEQVAQKTDRRDRDQDEKPPLSLPEAKNGALIGGDEKVQEIRDEPIRLSRRNPRTAIRFKPDWPAELRKSDRLGHEVDR